MTDHAPSVVAPGLREAAENALRALEVEHGHAADRELVWPSCEVAHLTMTELGAALRAESVAVAPEPTWCREHHAFDHCEDAILAKMETEDKALRAALHAPPALDAAPEPDLAAYGLLDIPMSDKAGIAFLDEMVRVRDERIADLEAQVVAGTDRAVALIRQMKPGGLKHKVDDPASSFDPLLRESEVVAALSRAATPASGEPAAPREEQP